MTKASLDESETILWDASENHGYQSEKGKLSGLSEELFMAF